MKKENTWFFPMVASIIVFSICLILAIIFSPRSAQVVDLGSSGKMIECYPSYADVDSVKFIAVKTNGDWDVIIDEPGIIYDDLSSAVIVQIYWGKTVVSTVIVGILCLIIFIITTVLYVKEKRKTLRKN